MGWPQIVRRPFPRWSTRSIHPRNEDLSDDQYGDGHCRDVDEACSPVRCQGLVMGKFASFRNGTYLGRNHDVLFVTFLTTAFMGQYNILLELPAHLYYSNGLITSDG